MFDRNMRILACRNLLGRFLLLTRCHLFDVDRLPVSRYMSLTIIFDGAPGEDVRGGQMDRWVSEWDVLVAVALSFAIVEHIIHKLSCSAAFDHQIIR